jgi:hypothetical protein
MTSTEKPRYEWYDYRAILSRAALVSLVSGPRSIGKTFGAKRDAVKRYLATGKQTMWLRRTHTALRPAKAGFFDGIAYLWPGFEFRVDGDEGQIRTDGDDWQTVIRFAALSTGSQLKGTEFPDVDWIIYDECFADLEMGERYLEEEPTRLVSLLITINRSRVSTRRGGKSQTRLLLLGNAITLDNPYFLFWGFDGLREWQKGSVTGGDVVMHLVDANKYERRVSKSIYGNILGTAVLGYAEGEYFRPDGGLVVSKRREDSKPFCTLVTERGVFGLWLTPDYQQMFVTVGPLADPNVSVVAFEMGMVRPGVPFAEPRKFIRSEVRRHYKRGSLFLVTPAAMAVRQALAK